ncbi:hypothetical protein IFM89_008320 [Coptis chinensis]|uniref:glucan endo-1,3-beta-D-glucosidase n=1 Tax=Coptis chinensis TaxID=261450 RepID=A0A835IBG0_9MAGN|nr:hypothetical protein IFM89_008320 [Coptis chinensis]
MYTSYTILSDLLTIARVCLTVEAFIGTYGVNYGRIADNLPPPESVVTLLKAAKIRNIRIYDADQSVLKAFKNSGIEIVVGIGNEFLKDMSVFEDRAIDWIKQNVQPYLLETHIRGIAVGNEVLGSEGNIENSEALLGAVKNVYSAVNRLGLTNLIQISSPHSEGVFANSFPPSSCIIKESLMPYMKPLLEFFSQINSPFFINAYPFLAYKSDSEHIDLNYALFQKNPGIYDAKTNLHYDNMFDAQVDAAYAALEAAGYGKMEVIVSETGWASRGDQNEAGADMKNARTYNGNLKKRLAKKKGTPLRPKIPVKAYVFALFNENLKPGPTSERNFGLFKPDGSISYDIGFTGLKPASSAATSSLLSFKLIPTSESVVGMDATNYFFSFLICLFRSCLYLLYFLSIRWGSKINSFFFAQTQDVGARGALDGDKYAFETVDKAIDEFVDIVEPEPEPEVAATSVPILDIWEIDEDEEA